MQLSASEKEFVLSRIKSRINITSSGCWEWQGPKSHNGYGVLSLPQNLKELLGSRVHRITYQIYVGDIPEGLQLDHLCRNRPCVNPQHVEPVTAKENIRRGETGKHNKHRGWLYQRMTTACVHGHPYDEKNTRIYKGKKDCRECDRIRSRKKTEKRRMEREGRNVQ